MNEDFFSSHERLAHPVARVEPEILEIPVRYTAVRNRQVMPVHPGPFDLFAKFGNFQLDQLPVFHDGKDGCRTPVGNDPNVGLKVALPIARQRTGLDLTGAKSHPDFATGGQTDGVDTKWRIHSILASPATRGSRGS